MTQNPASLVMSLLAKAWVVTLSCLLIAEIQGITEELTIFSLFMLSIALL